MPKRVEVGIVTSDKAPKSRRVEIPRLVNQACPAYSVAYGPCTSTFGHVQPETFYFAAPAPAAS